MYDKYKDNLFIMALLYLIIALVIQGNYIHADTNNTAESSDSEYTPNIPETIPKIDDEVVKDVKEAGKDWMDFFLLPDAHIFPTSAVTMMTQATNSEKSLEEQLEDIKDIAQQITLAIQSEMANLLTYAISTYEHDKEGEKKEGDETTENHLDRKRRSTESPMASTQLINRLLKHIKSNNEYQNIAIDKMMTAQEIADKYGIEFSPDTEIISDLAFAANQQAKEMTDLLQESLEMKNTTKKEELKKAEGACPYSQPKAEQDNYASTVVPVVNHHHHTESYPNYNYYYNYPYETQIPAPAPAYYSPPVSKRPNFYDTVSYSPDYYPYCSMEPVTTTTTIVLPYEEPEEAEPELVGEEFEETVSSKVYVDRGDEPGSATVNHVMTYTVGEKSHFKSPAIEKLPQQMQYCFFLM